MSQTKNGNKQARGYFYSILAMLGMLGLVGGGVLAMIRIAAKPGTPSS